MPENKHLRFLLYILYAALALAGFWLVLRFLLPWLAPFLLAFLLAALLERPVKLCMNRLHLPRLGGRLPVHRGALGAGLYCGRAAGLASGL